MKDEPISAVAALMMGEDWWQAHDAWARDEVDLYHDAEARAERRRWGTDQDTAPGDTDDEDDGQARIPSRPTPDKPLPTRGAIALSQPEPDVKATDADALSDQRALVKANALADVPQSEEDVKADS